jgi:hypothetical protein
MDNFESIMLELDELISNLLMYEEGTEEYKELQEEIKLLQNDLITLSLVGRE